MRNVLRTISERHNKALQTDERRASVVAHGSASLAPLAAERQSRSAAMKGFRVIEIREERPGDVAAIRDVNKRAFGQDQEGNIVDALRSNGAALLSLVATLNDLAS